MDWFYSQMLQMHALLAWFSVLFFVVRGLAALFDAEWRMDGRVLTLAFGAYTLLAVSGLSLWSLLQHNPMRDNWLAAKLIALVVYGVCAHWAVGTGRLRAVGYVLGLLMLAYVMGLSMTRQVLLGL
ncbi:MAG: hypothetical protein C0423_16625 [Methylibium sp.]|nr:hypothetical protein [Methylibium sp.]